MTVNLSSTFLAQEASQTSNMVSIVIRSLPEPYPKEKIIRFTDESRCFGILHAAFDMLSS